MSSSDAANPLTPLHQAAQQIHEMFMSYIAAGFSRSEALYLIAELLRAQQAPPQSRP